MKKVLANIGIKENLLLFAEVIIMILCLWGYTGPKFSMEIPYQDFIGTTIPDDRNGWYVDNTFPLESSKIFDFTANIQLDKGTYEITLYYETDANVHYVTTAATTKSFNALKTDKVILSPKVQETTFTIYLAENVENFRVETYYGGSGYLIVKGCSIRETGGAFRIRLAELLFFFVLLDGILLARKLQWFKKLSNKSLLTGTVLTATVLLASYPLFTGYLMMSHDIGFHLLRIEGVKEGLLAGQFPVKIQPNWMYGFGYPTSVYYGDLFLYIPALLRLIGFSAQFSYNTLLLLCNIATVYIAYWSFSRLAKDSDIGVFGAYIFTLAPYRLTNLYVRNALGETLALTFLPLIAYGFCEAIRSEDDQTHKKRLWIPMLIGFSGIIQSHLLTCIMCAIFIIICCIFCCKRVFRKKTFIELAKTVVYTAILNAWFLIPCMTSMENIDVMLPYRRNIRIQLYGTHIAQLFQLFYPGRGDSYFADRGIWGEFAQGVGLAMAICLFLFVTCIIFYRNKQISPEKRKNIKVGSYFFGLSILALFMTTVYFPWDFLSETVKPLSKVIANIQFATRFLVIANVCITATACMAFSAFKDEQGNGKEKYVLPLIIILLTTISATHMMDDRINNSSADYTYDITRMGRTDHNVKEYLPEGTDITALMPGKIETGDGIFLSSYDKKAITVRMHVMNSSDIDSFVELPLLYYSWYHAEDEVGTVLELVPGENNVVRVIVPSGYEGAVTVAFREPILWRIAEILSVCVLIVMIGDAIRKRKYVRAKERETSAA